MVPAVGIPFGDNSAFRTEAVVSLSATDGNPRRRPPPCSFHQHHLIIEQNRNMICNVPCFCGMGVGLPNKFPDNQNIVVPPSTPIPESAPITLFAPPGAQRRTSCVVLAFSMEMLTECYHEDFDSLRNTGRVETVARSLHLSCATIFRTRNNSRIPDCPIPPFSESSITQLLCCYR